MENKFEETSNLETNTDIPATVSLNPGEEGRNIDRLAIEKFDGNMSKTIRYVIAELTGEEQEKFVLEMNEEEILCAQNAIYDIIEERYGKKEIRKIIELPVILEELGMTEEELKSCAANPYSADFKKHMLVLSVGVIAIGVFVALSDYLENNSLMYISGILSVVAIFYLTNKLTGSIMKFLKFRKAKKLVADSANNTEDDSNRPLCS